MGIFYAKHCDTILSQAKIVNYTCANTYSSQLLLPSNVIMFKEESCLEVQAIDSFPFLPFIYLSNSWSKIE